MNEKNFKEKMDFYKSKKEELKKEQEELFFELEQLYNDNYKKVLINSYEKMIPKRQLDFMNECIEEDFSITIKSKKGKIECEVEENNDYSLAVGLYILEQTTKNKKLPQPIVDIVKDICKNKFEYDSTVKE